MYRQGACARTPGGNFDPRQLAWRVKQVEG
jgi:hypothetical protein